MLNHQLYVIIFIFLFIIIIWRGCFSLSPCSRGKLAICVWCSERMPPFYSLSSFMVQICTILKFLILVYMQNIPVLQQKKNMLKRFKKILHHTYIFWTLYCCFTMCFNLWSRKKIFEINALFIKFYWTLCGSKHFMVHDQKSIDSFKRLLTLGPRFLLAASVWLLNGLRWQGWSKAAHPDASHCHGAR